MNPSNADKARWVLYKDRRPDPSDRKTALRAPPKLPNDDVDIPLDNNNTLTTINSRAPIFQHFDRLPHQDDFLTTLGPVCATLYIASRPLAKLPPAKRWKRSLKNAWVRARFIMAKSLKAAIDAFEQHADALTLLNATLNLMALPSHFLIPAAGLRSAAGNYTLELPGGLTSTLSLPECPRRKNNSPHQPLTQNDTLLNGKDIDRLAKTAAELIRNDRRDRAIKALTSHGTAPSK